ncbi:MAG TPA: ABC transporter permease [Candidatus Competibacteraceae bacterium]|nr:ABC transporter permease [Candidatus Competibacteraceae bacterium]
MSEHTEILSATAAAAGERWRPSLRFLAVWRRHFLVWRKLLWSAIIGNFGEPLFYLLALGYGLGRFVGELEGLPYLVFLASGTVCSSAMMAAAFEATFSAYTRLDYQQTWMAMLTAPLAVEDVVLGEVVWAATKASFAAVPILLVAALLGLTAGWGALWVVPLVLLTALCFAALAMCVTVVARSYDYFTYLITLLLTPMMLLSGVFFPLSELPAALQGVVWLLPLAHAVALIRPLMTGGELGHVLLHLAVLAGYTVVAFGLAVRLARRRLMS